MSSEQTQLTGPDFEHGIGITDLPEGTPVLGHAHGEAVLLTRFGTKCYAVGATCTHYSGPLAEGLVDRDRVHCPWHHACFSLRTGAMLSPPALNDLPCWRVEQRDARVYVREKIEQHVPRGTPKRAPRSVVIVGAGAAGQTAAETLRREGYDGPITMIDPDPSAPVDRPNLSKDYLAGKAQPEWIPLRPPEFFGEQHIELVRGHEVQSIDPRARRVSIAGGETREFDALILATGSDPIRLDLGPSGPPVFYLRSLADSDAIIAAATGTAKRVIVLGASFIGLEVAASLRARDLDVHVVAPESRPLERILGPELGDAIRALHESKGVVFHLGRTAKSRGKGGLVLDDGSQLDADFIVAGVGVRPRTQLAERAGLSVDRGVVVNEMLETSVPGIFAAGDIARWPSARFGGPIRVEHWVLAQRQGQVAARNVLGANERFTAAPFFWSAHYDVTVSYVGHAQKWDRTVVDGDPRQNDCTVRYLLGEKELAVATIFRDKESLAAERRMESDATSV